MSEIKCHVCGFIGSSADCLGWEHTCTDIMKDKNKDLERKLAEARELIKAVAHIGIDWGYGKFELNQDHIDKARKLYEAHDQLKEQD